MAQANAQGIIGGLRFADNRVGWEFGETLGIRSFIATSGLINNVERVLHGDIDGKIFEQEIGNDFNGEDILAVYATPFFYFDSTEKEKHFKRFLSSPDQKELPTSTWLYTSTGMIPIN